MAKSNICRTCAEKMSNLEKNNRFSDNLGQGLFEQIPIAGELHSAAQMITLCCSLPVEENDGLPEFICKECIKKLCNAYEFKLLCEKSFKLFIGSTACSTEKIKTEKEDYVDNLIDDNAYDMSIKDEFEDRNLKNEDCSNFDTENICDFNEVSFDETIHKLKSSKKHKKKLKKKRRLKSNNLDVVINDCNDFNVNNVICDDENICDENDFKNQNEKHLNSESGLFVCNICQKTFKCIRKFENHQDSHLGIKRYFCEICQKSYRVKRDHIDMHRRGFNHKCDLCSKCFNTKAKLNIHLITHSDNRTRISCDFKGCSKTFLSLNGLERHKVSHMGVKEFICHLCSKSFIDKYQLETHIKRHMNVRPFSCSYCSKKFTTSSAKTSHERWHTNVRNFNCQICGKSFVCSSGLKRHLLCHTKSQDQECRFCGKKFNRLDHKKRHEIAVHGISDDKNVQKSELLI